MSAPVVDDSLVNLLRSLPGSNLGETYAAMNALWAPSVYVNPNRPTREQGDAAHRQANAAAAIQLFVFALDTEARFPDILRRAVGVFNGQLRLWLVSRGVSVEMTKALFDLKAAIEDQLEADFELHVEPLGDRSIDDLTPPGYVLI